MKAPNGQCTKRCKWLKVTKTKKTLEKTQKKQFSESLGWDQESRNIVFFSPNVFPRFLPLFRESWLGPPPSKESRNIVVFVFLVFCFSKVFNKCGVLQGNWHESQAKLSKCPWECSKTSVKTSQHIILNHGKNCTPRGCRSEN